MKPFNSIDAQLKILKSRGLNFTNEEKAKRYLLTNNYYNVINGYSKFFTTRNNKHKYIPIANFDEITSVHLFDKELKNILLRGLIEAEKHFKSIVAYRFSDKHRQPYSYLKTECYKKTTDWKEISKISKLIGALSNIVNSNIKDKKSNAIKHHYKNHGEIPFWVLCNDMTFGQIITFFNLLDDKIKDAIARDLSTFLQSNIENRTGQKSKNIISVSTLSKVLNNANEFRNIAAHNNLIFNHRCWKNLPNQKWLPSDCQKCNSQGLYYVFLYLQGFLSASQYSILHNSIRKRVVKLRANLLSIPVSKILKALDFPENWDTISPLPMPANPHNTERLSMYKIQNNNRPKAVKLRFKARIK